MPYSEFLYRSLLSLVFIRHLMHAFCSNFIPRFICDDFWLHSTNWTSSFVFVCTKILATAQPKQVWLYLFDLTKNVGFYPTFSRHGIAQTSLALLVWLSENVHLKIKIQQVLTTELGWKVMLIHHTLPKLSFCRVLCCPKHNMVCILPSCHLIGQECFAPACGICCLF